MAEQGSQRSSGNEDGGVTARCPFCGQNTHLKPPPPLPKRLRRLYDAAVEAGEAGATYEAVRKSMWGSKERSNTTIRTAIHRINTLLLQARTGTQIISRGHERIYIVRS